MDLLVRRPFDLELTLTMGQALRWREGEEGWYVGVLRGHLIKVRQTYDRVEFRCNVPADDARHLLADYRRLDEDILPVHQALLERSPDMAELVERYGGLRVLRQEPWECLITYVCSPRNMVKNNIRAVEVLAAHYGETLSLDGIERSDFPTPAALEAAGVDELRALWLGLPRHAEYIHNLAQEVTAGFLSLDDLRGMPYEEAKRRLMACKGIGSKVADCILLFSCDKREAFPIDTNIRRALRAFCALEGTDAQLSERARDRFGKQAGYASQLLFHGIRTIAPNGGRTLR